jgi:uracil-DNA glycosylase family 4
MIKINGEGSASARIMIVGECPSTSDVQSGRPFSGESGKVLDHFLSEAGIKRGECYLTNVVKYRAPGFKFKELGIDFDEQERLLWNEIESIQPNVIIALGDLSCKTLTGNAKVASWRGSILQTKRGLPKVIPTYSPAYFLYSREESDEAAFRYYQKYVTIFDFKRAVDQSRFREYRLPERNLWVCRSSAELYDFIRRNERNEYLSVDIESHNCVPTAIGLAFKKHEALSIPFTSIYGPSNPDGVNKTELINLWRMLFKLLDAKKIIGQNFKYDEQVLTRLGFRMRLAGDTMLLQHTLNPEFPQSLAFITSVYTEEPYYKDEGKGYNPKKDPFSRLLLYNAKDAAVTIESWEVMVEEAKEVGVWDFFNSFVQPAHYLHSEMESRGLRVDYARRQEIIQKYEDQAVVLGKRINEIAGFPVNVNSPKDVPLFLFEHLKFPRREHTDEETLVALQANHAKTAEKYEAIDLILEKRRVNKTLGTYLYALPDYDDRMRTSIRITGTETGRVSNQILKPPIRPQKIGLAFQTITKHGETGSEIRSYFIPDPGKVFINADLSQADARVVAILSQDEELLRDFAEGNDIHSKTAAIVFGGDWKQYTKAAHGGEECNERFVGKTVRHAGNYDMKKNRLMIEVNTSAKKYGISFSFNEAKAGYALTRFHKANPNIKGVFHELIRQRLSADRTLVNPFGRRRVFYERWDSQLFGEAYAYIPQSTVHDHLVRSMLQIQQRQPRLQFLLDAHDAFLGQIEPELVDETAEMILEVYNTPIDFSRCSIQRGSLIIPGEVEVGENYRDLKKWRRKHAT